MRASSASLVGPSGVLAQRPENRGHGVGSCSEPQPRAQRLQPGRDLLALQTAEHGQPDRPLGLGQQRVRRRLLDGVRPLPAECVRGARRGPVAPVGPGARLPGDPGQEVGIFTSTSWVVFALQPVDQPIDDLGLVTVGERRQGDPRATARAHRAARGSASQFLDRRRVCMAACDRAGSGLFNAVRSQPARPAIPASRGRSPPRARREDLGPRPGRPAAPASCGVARSRVQTVLAPGPGRRGRPRPGRPGRGRAARDRSAAHRGDPAPRRGRSTSVTTQTACNRPRTPRRPARTAPAQARPRQLAPAPREGRLRAAAFRIAFRVEPSDARVEVEFPRSDGFDLISCSGAMR